MTSVFDKRVNISLIDIPYHSKLSELDFDNLIKLFTACCVSSRDRRFIKSVGLVVENKMSYYLSYSLSAYKGLSVSSMTKSYYSYLYLDSIRNALLKMLKS